MKIAVCGWYLDSAIYNTLKKMDNVYIVSHNPDIKKMVGTGLRFTVIGNIGLEFHCYNHYLYHYWDTTSDVLFMHDDVIIPVEVFQEISELKVDQAYLFTDAGEEKRNGGKHGRAIFMSGRLLKYLKHHNGIWYDMMNKGYTGKGHGGINRVDHNRGINEFHRNMGRIRDIG